MRTAISIAILATSTTALALVLWLVITKPWETEPRVAGDSASPKEFCCFAPEGTPDPRYPHIAQGPPEIIVPGTYSTSEVEALNAVRLYMWSAHSDCGWIVNTTHIDYWTIVPDPRGPKRYRVSLARVHPNSWTGEWTYNGNPDSRGSVITTGGDALTDCP